MSYGLIRPWRLYKIAHPYEMTASDQYRESRGSKKTPAVGVSRGLGTHAMHGLLRGRGGLGQAPDVYDFERPSFQRLYKIAHSESTVDYVDNPPKQFQTEAPPMIRQDLSDGRSVMTPLFSVRPETMKC
jgi:hypothetical protein